MFVVPGYFPSSGIWLHRPQRGRLDLPDPDSFADYRGGLLNVPQETGGSGSDRVDEAPAATIRWREPLNSAPR
jgi:hypothetical protein